VAHWRNVKTSCNAMMPLVSLLPFKLLEHAALPYRTLGVHFAAAALLLPCHATLNAEPAHSCGRQHTTIVVVPMNNAKWRGYLCGCSNCRVSGAGADRLTFTRTGRTVLPLCEKGFTEHADDV
jgi:hypothetical protein